MFIGHSMSDPGVTYRKKDEVDEYRKSKDPIVVVKSIILENKVASEEDLKVFFILLTMKTNFLKRVLKRKLKRCAMKPLKRFVQNLTLMQLIFSRISTSKTQNPFVNIPLNLS